MMKIICTDNFGRDNISDILIAENISSEHHARCMAKALNKEFCSHDGSPVFFRAVVDSYKLYKWEP